MSETTYFWQDGRKIEIQQDDESLTIHANDVAEARGAAERAGVKFSSAEVAGPGLVCARAAGNRDETMSRLRANENVVHHVYRGRQEKDSEYLITESFFVKFKPDTPEARIRQYFDAEHLIIDQDMGNKTYLVRVTTDTGRNPIRTANAAASRDDVEYAEPNLVRRLTRFDDFIPSDPLFSSQWHLHAPVDVPPDLVAGAGIFAPRTWSLTRGRRDVVIAVADDGFDLTHPDFQGEGKVVAQLNAGISGNANNASINWDSNVSPRPGDYHGTPCLGVAVAEGNGTGVVGVAPGCSLVAVRFPLSMSDAHFIVMFNKVSTLADIISCSWGVGPANAPMSSTLRNAMSSLARTGGRRGKGLIFCIAAGNNNAPVKDLSNTRTYLFRDQFGTIHSYSGPIDRWVAAHPDVITVSAVTSRKTRSAYSSWGKQISVCAPSDNWDDLGQSNPPGRGITTTDNEGFGANSDFTAGSRFTGSFGGTSSATPTVAGTCGLVLSANGTLTAEQVKALLQRTADKDLSLVTDTPVNEPGDFNAGFSQWFGHGKINAARAVEEAVGATQAEQVVEAEVSPALPILDVGSPVSSSIDIARDGMISDIRIHVDIAHTYIGDLRVDLIAPDGTGVSLHNNTGGPADNLVRTYTVNEIPSLRSLFSRPIRGTWRLRVVDTVRLDSGTLRRWRIAARVSGSAPGPLSRADRGGAASQKAKARGTIV